MGEISSTKGNDMCIGPQASNLNANLPAKSPHGTTKRICLFICGLHDPVKMQNGKTITDLRITNETIVGSSEHDSRHLLAARMARVLSEIRNNRSPSAQMASAAASDKLLSIEVYVGGQYRR